MQKNNKYEQQEMYKTQSDSQLSSSNIDAFQMNSQIINSEDQKNQTSFSKRDSKQCQQNESFISTKEQSQNQEKDQNYLQFDTFTNRSCFDSQFLNIDQFYQILYEDINNQYNVKLDSYKLNYWQNQFREIVIHHFDRLYSKHGLADYLTIDEIAFQIHNKTFAILYKKKLSNYFTPATKNSRINNQSKKQNEQKTKSKECYQTGSQRHELFEGIQKNVKNHKGGMSKQATVEMIDSFSLKICLIKFYSRLLNEKIKSMLKDIERLNTEPIVAFYREYQLLLSHKNIKNSSSRLLKRLNFLEVTVKDAKRLLRQQTLKIRLMLAKEVQLRENPTFSQQAKQLNEDASFLLLTIQKQLQEIAKNEKQHNYGLKMQQHNSNYIKFLLTLEQLHYMLNYILKYGKNQSMIPDLELFFQQQHQTVSIITKFFLSQAKQKIHHAHQQKAPASEQPNNSVLDDPNLETSSIQKDTHSFLNDQNQAQNSMIYVEKEQQSAKVQQTINPYNCLESKGLTLKTQLTNTNTFENKKCNQNSEHQKKQSPIKNKCKLLMESIILHNYLIINIQFSSKKKFNYDRFSTIIQNGTDFKFKDLSLIDKKLTVLQNIQKKNQKVKRFYFQNLYNRNQFTKFQSQNIKIKTTKTQKSSTFGFNSLYHLYADEEWISQKVRYLIHFSQFCIEVIFELTNSKSLIMSSIFNSVRFSLSFLICHLWFQCILKVFEQIEKQNGYFYFEVFLNILEKQDRWISAKDKIMKIFQTAVKKLQTYRKEAMQLAFKKPNYDKNKIPYNNSEKFQQICHQYPFAEQLFSQIKLKTFQEYISQKYDFQFVKKIHSLMIYFTFTDFSNKNFLKKRLQKNILNIKTTTEIKEYLKFYPNLTCSENQILLFLGKNKKSEKPITLQNMIDTTNQYEQYREYQFIFQLFTFYCFETLKISSMILSLPFYSFQTEISNIKRKKKLQTNQKYELNPFTSLDELYIMNGKKLQTDQILSLIMNINQSSKQNYNLYIGKISSIFEFLDLKDLKRKVSEISSVPQRQSLRKFFKYPQYIHSDRLSIFSVQQCEEYFLRLFNNGQKMENKMTDAIDKYKELVGFIRDFKAASDRVLGKFIFYKKVPSDDINSYPQQAVYRKAQQASKQCEGKLMGEGVKKGGDSNQNKRVVFQHQKTFLTN